MVSQATLISLKDVKIEELEKATDKFSDNRVTVYKGMLSDGTIVAIKKANKADESQRLKFRCSYMNMYPMGHSRTIFKTSQTRPQFPGMTVSVLLQKLPRR
ncbi:hypothetical protein ACS0TY_017796 [Phlomoides rotata]